MENEIGIRMTPRWVIANLNMPFHEDFLNLCHL
jgi:hypothetical protein